MDFPRGKKHDQKWAAGSPGSLFDEDRKQPSLQPQHEDPPPAKKRPWRKPKDMPKRPLSAYNIFFADERKELLKARERDDMDLSESRNVLPDTSGQPSESQKQKLGFAGLARTIAAKWKALDNKARYKYEQQAEIEKLRYKSQMKEYNEQRLKAQQQVINNTTHSGSSSIWPAMPQTIATLGDIYDSTPEQSSQRSGLVPFEGVAAVGTPSDSATGLVMPKTSYIGTRSDLFPSAPEMGSNTCDHPPDFLGIPLYQPEAKRIRRPDNAEPLPNPAAMVHWNARRLSSPENISILAAELGQDQVDFFLRTLRKDQDDDEEEINQS
jgi:hypothetical protein